MITTIALAESDVDILACHPVMHELRPAITRDEFLVRVRRQQTSGYHLAFVGLQGDPVAVAGFRIGENLAWGRFLYVDDLVTRSHNRSQGHGRSLLNWLAQFGLDAGCEQMHLDSGLQRVDAHRFYEREAMPATGYHFAKTLANHQPD